MIQKALTSRLYYKVCCFALYIMVAAASFHGFYDKWHFGEAEARGEDDRFNFEAMVDGTAYRPYVYRQLLPAAANWISQAAPHSFESWLYSHQGGSPEEQLESIFNSPTVENPAYRFRYLILYVLTFLSALLAVYAMYLVCRATEVPPLASVFAPACVILLVPYFQSGGGFFYDYPELAFLALAVWVALKFDWWWIIPVAALGTWNKESFLFFIPTLYPLLRRKSSRAASWLGIGVLCIVCFAVYYPIHLRFEHNPGGTLELHWRNHLEYFLHPRDLLFGTETTYGIRMVKAFSPIPLALLAWTVWRAWRHLPRAIQHHGQIAAVINFPLYLLFCSPGEIRNLSMLYILFLFIVATNLNHWIDSPVLAKAP